MPARTLAQLQDNLLYRYDLTGFTARHPQVSVFRLINDAYREYRERLTSDGVDVFVSSVELTDNTIGKSAAQHGTQLSGLDGFNFTVVREVVVKWGGIWMPLVEVAPAELVRLNPMCASGIPQYWSAVHRSEEIGSIADELQWVRIVVTPCTTAPTMFRVTGLRNWSEMTASNDAIYVDFGAEDYIQVHVGLAMAERDEDVNLTPMRREAVESTYRKWLKILSARNPNAVQRTSARRRSR